MTKRTVIEDVGGDGPWNIRLGKIEGNTRRIHRFMVESHADLPAMLEAVNADLARDGFPPLDLKEVAIACLTKGVA